MITIGTDAHVRNSYLHVTDVAGNLMRCGRCRKTMMDLADAGVTKTGQQLRFVFEAAQRGARGNADPHELDGHRAAGLFV